MNRKELTKTVMMISNWLRCILHAIKETSPCLSSVSVSGHQCLYVNLGCPTSKQPSLPPYTSLDREKYEMLKGLCEYSSPVLSCRQVVQLYEL